MIQTFKHLNPFQMRRAIRDYRYEVGENRMTEECSQYLAQLQKDWERQRVKLGVEAIRKSVKACSLVDACVSYHIRLPIVKTVTLISMMELHPTKPIKLLKRLLSPNPTRLLHKSRSTICSRERSIGQNGYHRSLLQSLGNSLTLDTCYHFSFHPTQYTWVRYPSYRRRNASRMIVVKQKALDRRASTAVGVGVVWDGRLELENSESWGQRYSILWVNPSMRVAVGNGPSAPSKSEMRLTCRVRLAATSPTRRQLRSWKWKTRRN